MWVFALEEVFTFSGRDVMWKGVNNFGTYNFALLTDIANLGDFDNANFAMTYTTGWHPTFLTKFYKGSIWPTPINHPRKAYNCSSAFEFEKNRWYQLTLTWDFENQKSTVYANGITIATDDAYKTDFFRTKTNDTLFTGRPFYCFGDIKFYDKVLSQAEAEKIFKDEATAIDPNFQHHLAHRYEGKDLKKFTWQPDAEWLLTYDRTMKEKDFLDECYIQGEVKKIEIGEEGTRIITPEMPYTEKAFEKQMYLWPKQWFEGDLYAEFEFYPNKEFGLVLFMMQASGISREMFLKDFPLPTTGSMKTVHSSHIRNYHIEFYRNMNMVRNDLSNVALIKNPYQFPMAFGNLNYKMKSKKWHKFQVLQHNGEITICLDGWVVAQAQEHKFVNNGPILNAGNIAIRCMVNTDVTFRNLKVYNKKLPYRVE